MTPTADCDCTIEGEHALSKGYIVFCPLHAAASTLAATLRESKTDITVTHENLRRAEDIMADRHPCPEDCPFHPDIEEAIAAALNAAYLQGQRNSCAHLISGFPHDT